MSSNRPTPGPGKGLAGGSGSVKRAREMLEAGVRPQVVANQADRPYQPRPQNPPPGPPSTHGPQPRGPPPQRPQRPPYYDQGRPDSADGEINIGYKADGDPRGPVPFLPIQGLPVPKQTGPQPGSRKGRMSSFSRGTHVSPIPEEVPEKRRRKNKGSFASSAAIPSSWGSGVPPSDILDYYDSGDDGERDAEPTIVRNASLGKRGKPSLRTISKATLEGGKSPVAEPVPDVPKGYSQNRPSSDSDSIDSIELEKQRQSIENEQQDKSSKLAMPGPGFSSKRNARRPPRLDLGTVRSAEARGSLTSLPDLIRRATRVASNLEHGRTASKLGMLDMFDSGKEPKRPKPAYARSSASLSDILASFPPPRTDTPDDVFRNSWPYAPVGATEKSRLRNVQDNENEGDPEEPRRRRFCGMSRRLFIILCIIALCAVIAAIIIPIVVVVLPRTRHDNSTTVAASTMSSSGSTSCDQKFPCLNGGVSVSTGNSCSCVCVNGFSGSQCGNATDGSCTTTRISSTANATVGSSLPHLFATSESNFSIPLNKTEIVGLFNSENVSCTVQNDLVFFNTENLRARREPLPTNVQDATITGTPGLGRSQENTRDDSSSLAPPPILSVPTGTTSSSGSTTGTAWTGGSMETASASSPTSKSQSSETTMTPSATASSTSTAGATLHKERIFDFARVAVLFILEQTRHVDSASKARSDIALALLSKSDDTLSKMKVTMANKSDSFILNFNNFTITLPDGKVAGG